MPVTFRRYQFGQGDIKFKDPQTGQYAHEVTTFVPVGSSYMDLEIKGAVASSYVLDVEYDGRVRMRDNIYNGQGHPVEGIGVTCYYTVATCNIFIDGVEEGSELTVGGAVALNNNDSNANGVEDRDPADADTTTVDPDLRKYTVAPLQPADLTGTSQSKVSVGFGGGAIRLWDSATKAGDAYVLVDPYPEDAVPGVLPTERWIEGVSIGSAPRGVIIHGFFVNQGYTKTGVKTVEDLVSVTVFGVEVDPEETDLMPLGLLFERGLTVMANRDDDDGDKSADYLNCTHPGGNQAMENDVEDDELYELEFTSPIALSAEEFSLTLPTGWEAFDDREKTTLLPSPIPGPIGPAGKKVYLEAKDLSAGVKDQEFTIVLSYQGVSSTLKFRATVGIVCGVQYVTQLSTWRYEALFPTSEGTPTLTTQRGTKSAVPDQSRQVQIAYGNYGGAYQNDIAFEFTSGRKLKWTIDIFNVDVDQGTASAGNAPLEAGSDPVFDQMGGTDYHEFRGSPESSKSMYMRYDFTATSPRASNSSPGGVHIGLGLLQNVKVSELQSVLRASSDGTVPESTTLYNPEIVGGTAAWYWDTLEIDRDWYDLDDAFDTLEEDGGTISGSGITTDRPKTTLPILCERTVDPPDAEYCDGDMPDYPSSGDSAPSGMGSIKSTSSIYDFRVWIAIRTCANLIHSNSGVYAWNYGRWWALTKGFWRMRVAGTNANSGWAWDFTADQQNNANTCASTDNQAPTSSLATWTKLTTTTAPTQVRSDKNANEEFADKYGDDYWEEK